QRDGERGCRGIRVDVERVTGVLQIWGDAGDDGDAPGPQVVEHGGGVDRDDIADPAEVDLFAVDDRAAPAAAEQPGILATQARGQRPVRVDFADQLRVHLTGEHHAHDADRLGACYPVAALELAGDREP